MTGGIEACATGSQRTGVGVDGKLGDGGVNGGKTGAGGNEGGNEVVGNLGGGHVEVVSTVFDRFKITGVGCGVRSCIRVRTFSTVGVGERRSVVRCGGGFVFPFKLVGDCVVVGNRCALVNAAVDVFFRQPFSSAGTGRGDGYLFSSRSVAGSRFIGGKAWS